MATPPHLGELISESKEHSRMDWFAEGVVIGATVAGLRAIYGFVAHNLKKQKSRPNLRLPDMVR